MKKSTLAFSFAFLMPVLALAQNVTYINNWIGNIRYWLSQAVTLLMVAMTVWFLIAVFQYIRVSDPKEIADKKKVMINALIGLFVSVSVWGIIAILGNILGTNRTNINLGSPTTGCPVGYTNVGGRCL